MTWLALAACAQPAGVVPRAPLELDGLRDLARAGVAVELLREIDGGDGFRAHLLGYRHAGLQLHALLAVPIAAAPPGGWPVLVANHGYHPEPPRYGITAAGRDWRPGDYYRSIPRAYTAAGFLVVMADYRGHNSSEGLAFTRHAQAVGYYSEDVVALMSGLAALPQADLRRVFLWGHSMGGEITLNAALAVAGVRGASLWSTSAGSRGASQSAQHLSALQVPLLIHHAQGDASTEYRGSQRLAERLQQLGKPHALHSYPGSDHFFTGEQFARAVARDVQFFRSLMQP
jgi:alpha-beta hydrolase superfamily lysophospholipase